jgi:hypothetical protein
LDIASITIPESARGRGWFRQFRQIAEALNPWDATYYEAVLNPRLEAYFNEAYFNKEGLFCVNENSYYAVRQPRAESKMIE